MKDILYKFLGPSWPVKILGWLGAGIAYIALNPESVEFLPDNIENFVIGAAKLLAVIAAGGVASITKGSHVTGGNIPATAEALVRTQNALPVDKEGDNYVIKVK